MPDACTRDRPSFKFDLGRTNTYARRECVWAPGPRADCPTADGTLMVMLAKGWRSDSGWECDDYAVEEQARVDGHEPGRVFVVLNLDDDTGEGLYEVFLADRSALNAAGEVVWPYDRCECKAGKCKAPCCKHRDALRAVVLAGKYHAVE